MFLTERGLTRRALAMTALLILVMVLAVWTVTTRPGDDGVSAPGDAGADGGAGASSTDGQGGGGSGTAGAGGDATGGGGASGGNGAGTAGGGSGGDGNGGSGGAGGAGSGSVSGGQSSPGPAICGPEEFLGGLPAFVAKIGDPDLIPVLIKKDPLIGKKWTVFDTVPSLGVASPLIKVPMTVIGGANRAYGPVGDLVRGICPHISGDPHVYTMDGRRYDFQGVGEYVALRSDDGSVEVQVRTVAWQDSTRVSTVRGVALSVDGHTLVVDNTADVLVTLDGNPLVAPSAIRTENDAYILRDEKEVAVYWPDGYTAVSITRISANAMSVYFTLLTDLGGAVGGLMGNADGDRANDLALPDGTVLGDDFESINRELRDAWRVTGTASLFEGPSQYRSDYPTQPVVLTRAESRAAREVCVAAGVVVGGLLAECTLDVAVTGDQGFAAIHLEGQRDRMVVRNPECRVAASGPSGMAGNGPERTWGFAPLQISGTRVWSFEPETREDPRVAAVVPISDDEALVVDLRNGIHLIDGAGQIIWTVDASPNGDVSPLIVGDTAFVATADGLLAIALDGEGCWHLIVHEGERLISLAHADGRIIATTISSGVAIAIAIDPTTGRVLWSNASEIEVAAVRNDTAAAVADGLVVVSGERGAVLAIDAASGKRVWAYTPDRADTVSAIAVFKGVVYATGRSSGLTALDLASGGHRWTTAAPGGANTGRLAVGGGIAVVVDETIVRAVDLTTGALRWTVGQDEAVRAG